VSELVTVLAECQTRWEGEPPQSARRLFHGRGHCYDGLNGLTVDRFGTVLVIGCFDDRVERARELAGMLPRHLSQVTGVCLQHRQGRGNHTTVVMGEVPEEIEVEEAGLKYLVAPLRNQNVGLFLDMAPTRAWVRSSSEGRRVLNLFAYTCAFSVAALAGGARSVVNVDMSRPALDWGMRNHRLNGQDPRQVSMLAHNLFKSWQKLKTLGPFDLVIIDPPTNQRGSFNAEKQYAQVLKRLPDLSAAGADVVAALNSPFLNGDFLPAQMARWCPAARFQGMLPVSPDFPDRYPDRGLKLAHFRYA